MYRDTGKGVYLSSADGVLSGSASDVVDFVFLDQFFVERHMFLFSEDCIIGFDVVSIFSPTIELQYFSRMSVSLCTLDKMRKGVRT